MKHSIKIITAILIFAGLTYCSNSGSTETSANIEELENEIYNGDAIFTPEGKQKALNLVQLYQAFVQDNPDDSLSAGYLFKAADITLNLDDPGKAIAMYNKIILSYPDFNKAPECLFLTAYIYENHLQNYDKATEIYEDFIAKYPESAFADDARISIDNMGKTPEELIQEFERRNQEASSENTE